MKLAFFRLLSGVALLFLTSCVRSEQPLSAVSRARPDPGLAGVWRAEADQNAGKLVRISFDQQCWGRVAAKDRRGIWKEVPGIDGFFVTRTEKGAYINLLTLDDEKNPRSARHYTFYKYAFSHGRKRLHLWATNTDAFSAGVKQGKLKGREVKLSASDTFDSLLLQDSSDAVLRFIEARPAKEVFLGGDSYRKVD